MYKNVTLKNGLRIYSNDIPDRESVSLGFWVGVGGRYEGDKIKGAAHFLEHVVFKGSAKYACEEIKEKIEGVGGALNAFTSEEQTCYYAKIPAKHLEQTFDVLSDMVFFPKLNQADIAKESTVIIEEIKMYKDLPQYCVMEILEDLLWPGHPLGKSLTGTVESVAAMTSADLRSFHSDFYHPQNIVISVCGKLNDTDFFQMAQKKLNNVQSSKHVDFLKVNSHQSQPRFKFFKKDIEQMHVALGTIGFDENHKDRYALSLLGVILGGNMSSRLFVEVREKQGLAYSISSGMKTLHDTGQFLIRAGVDNKKIIQATGLILKELQKLKEKGVEQGEFTRAKDYLLGQMLIGLEDTMEHMLWIGESVISKNELRTVQDVVNDYNKISIDDIVRVANEILANDRLNLAIVGPIDPKQEKELRGLLNL